MGRIGTAKSSSWSSKPSRPSSSAPRVSSPPPPAPSLPSQIQVQPQSMMQNMKDGFGLGIGVSVARNMVDGIFNRFSSAPQQQPTAIPTTAFASGTSVTAEYQKREFMQCMEKVQDYDSCKKFLTENS